LVSVDGATDDTLIRLGTGDFVTDCVWLPDGSGIVASLYRSGAGGTASGAEISVITPGDPPQIRAIAKPDRRGSYLASPCWAPDGSGVFYENVGPPTRNAAVQQIEWTNADGGGRRVITAEGRAPGLSRDGSMLVHIKSAPEGEGIAVRTLATGDERLVVGFDKLLAVGYPRFSPDGSRICFMGVGASIERADPSTQAWLASPSGHGLPWNLFVVETDGSNLREAAPLAEDDATAAWSPDGSLIAVGGVSGIQIVNPADGSARHVSPRTTFGAIDWR
jgi:Tol biopolymer transport system component